MITLAFLLAQDAPPTPQAQPGLESMLVPLLLIGFVFYFLMIRPQSRERKKREEMLSTVKKNDRVATIGGILGTVLSVKDDEITLKVDESSNTKITFVRSAIQRIISTGPGEAGDSAVKK